MATFVLPPTFYPQPTPPPPPPSVLTMSSPFYQVQMMHKEVRDSGDMRVLMGKLSNLRPKDITDILNNWSCRAGSQGDYLLIQHFRLAINSIIRLDGHMQLDVVRAALEPFKDLPIMQFKNTLS